jgi:hypothetical protein
LADVKSAERANEFGSPRTRSSQSGSWTTSWKTEDTSRPAFFALALSLNLSATLITSGTGDMPSSPVSSTTGEALDFAERHTVLLIEKLSEV